jgi:hypothetical protein
MSHVRLPTEPLAERLGHAGQRGVGRTLTPRHGESRPADPRAAGGQLGFLIRGGRVPRDRSAGSAASRRFAVRHAAACSSLFARRRLARRPPREAGAWYAFVGPRGSPCSPDASCPTWWKTVPCSAKFWRRRATATKRFQKSRGLSPRVVRRQRAPRGSEAPPELLPRDERSSLDLRTCSSPRTGPRGLKRNDRIQADDSGRYAVSLGMDSDSGGARAGCSSCQAKATASLEASGSRHLRRNVRPTRVVGRPKRSVECSPSHGSVDLAGIVGSPLVIT